MYMVHYTNTLTITHTHTHTRVFALSLAYINNIVIVILSIIISNEEPAGRRYYYYHCTASEKKKKKTSGCNYNIIQVYGQRFDVAREFMMNSLWPRELFIFSSSFRNPHKIVYHNIICFPVRGYYLLLLSLLLLLRPMKNYIEATTIAWRENR